MTIWAYSVSTDEELYQLFVRRVCAFCGSRIEVLHDEEKFDGFEEPYYRRGMQTRRKVEICQLCGWWRIEDHINEICSQSDVKLVGPYTNGAAGALKRLSLHDISTPIDEVRSFLLGKQEARFDLHPRLFELTIASVFGDLGYEVKITAYSNDGGIDVILEKSGEEIGVQVKCYHQRVGVEQIRELVGALVLRDARTGIFVTTSDYTRGSKAARNRYAEHGYDLELIDGERFLHVLGITQRPRYSSYSEFLETIGRPGMRFLSGNRRELV